MYQTVAWHGLHLPYRSISFYRFPVLGYSMTVSDFVNPFVVLQWELWTYWYMLIEKLKEIFGLGGESTATAVDWYT